MTDLEFIAPPETGGELIVATSFFIDPKCSTPPRDDTWGLTPFKVGTGYSAMAPDTKLSY